MKARGFTLLEIVLAVAILGLVMSLLFGSFHSQDRVQAAAQVKTGSDQLARLVTEQITQDLEQAFDPHDPRWRTWRAEWRRLLSFKGQPEQIGLAEGHRLSFGFRSSEDEPVLQVTYQVRAAEEEAEGPLIIIRKLAPVLRQTQAREEVLCRRVAGLKIEYLARRSQVESEWLDEWTRATLPAAVRVTLSLKEPGGRVSNYEYTAGPLLGLEWRKGS